MKTSAGGLSFLIYNHDLQDPFKTKNAAHDARIWRTLACVSLKKTPWNFTKQALLPPLIPSLANTHQGHTMCSFP